MTGNARRIGLGRSRSRPRRRIVGGLGRVVDEALGEEDRLAPLAVLGPADAAMHQLGALFPVVAHVSLSRAFRPNKNPQTQVTRMGVPFDDLFSGVFNVARNPVTNRHAAR